MRATAEPVEGNRVRLSVEVDEGEIDEALDATVRRLARQVRVPGFRPGRVPRPVLEARLGGAEALRQQALSDALPDLYARAVVDTEVDPIAAPEIDITSGEEGGPFSFDAVVEVRPSVAIPGYQGLVVTLPGLAVTDEDVDRQVDRLREQAGELKTVGRAAGDGDYVTIDLHGTRPDADDLDVEDYLHEVGAGSDVDGLDDQLRGSKAGDILQFDSTLPAGSGGAPVAATFRVLVKEVKEKDLPPATDAWASEASEFDTLEELRADLTSRIGQVKLVQAQLALRDRAVEALVTLVEDEPPEPLVDAEVRERLHDLGHRLEERRMSFEQFLAASGRSEAELLEEIRGEAAHAVRVDLALRALADAEELEVDDAELDAALADMATQAGATAADLHRRLERAGRLPAVRSDQRKSKALAWLLDNVDLVDEEGAPIDREALRARAGEDTDVATPAVDGGASAEGRAEETDDERSTSDEHESVEVQS
ncbi:MAG TPA: trigger factor [Acidimicrobiales bacterium]|nr:trigger factor [Acidimicrobiales bacterium]